MHPTHVLCPLDGSPASTRALASAVASAKLFEVPLVLFSAVEDFHEISRQSDWLKAREVPASVSATVEVVVNPHAPQAIADRAGDDALVVMASSTQPLIHRGYLGSAAERVARRPSSQTMAIGPRATVSIADVERVVVPCDGSALSEQAIVAGRQWADRLNVDLWIITVLPEHVGTGVDVMAEGNYVRQLATAVEAQWDVLHGDDAARTIAGWSDQALVVMTSHGRSGLSRLTLGSTTTGVTRWASGPVVVNRPSVVEADEQPTELDLARH